MALLIASLSAPAPASTQLQGTIKHLYVNDSSTSNVAYISLGTSFTSTCVPASEYLVIDFSVAGMKEAYALALSASMAGRLVTVAGVGACYGQYEKVQYIFVSE